MALVEAGVEKKLVRAVKSVGGLCIKLPASLYRGIPDRMVLLPGGVLVFIELKRSKTATTQKRTAIHQARFKKLLTKLGFNHIRIEGPEDLEDFINDYLR